MVTAAPSACAASIVHDFTDSPSTSTVHAPQRRRVAPDLRAGEPALLAEVLHQQRARLDVVILHAAVHTHRYLHLRIMPHTNEADAGADEPSR